MKKVFAGIFLILSVSVKGQSILPHDGAGKITFTETIKLDSSDPSSADELYRRAKTWVLENFTNIRQVLVKDDNVNHLLILNGSGECYAPKSFGDTIDNAGHSYTLKIELNDSGYSYTMNDFKTSDKWKGEQPSEEVRGGKKQMQHHEQTISELAATLTKSLKLAMATKISVGSE